MHTNSKYAYNEYVHTKGRLNKQKPCNPYHTLIQITETGVVWVIDMENILCKPGFKPSRLAIQWLAC